MSHSFRTGDGTGPFRPAEAQGLERAASMQPLGMGRSASLPRPIRTFLQPAAAADAELPEDEAHQAPMPAQLRSKSALGARFTPLGSMRRTVRRFARLGRSQRVSGF